MQTTEQYTGALAKRIGKGLKKDLGAKTVRQNYKGTGSQAARRQLYCRFSTGAVIDIWIGTDGVRLGGVVEIDGAGNRVKPATNIVRGDDIEVIYGAVKDALDPWVNAS